MKKIEQKAIKFIDEQDLIQKNDKILVALSGGPDSVFLLHFLHKYHKRFDISISAIHINHKLRGNQAGYDQKFCETLCKDLGIEFFTVNKNISTFAKKKKISLEEAGREIRYSEFDKTAKKYDFKKIATAHNSSDNVETVLLNLIKGAGLQGISGIPIKRDNIIRPVLSLTKQEILSYLDENKIEYRTDETNFNSDFERNFLRNKIIPLLKEKLNPSLDGTILKSSEIFRNLLNLQTKRIENAIADAVNFSKDTLTISIPKLLSCETELFGEIFKYAIYRNFSRRITFNDSKKIISLVENQSGRKVELSENLIVLKDRDYLKIAERKNKQEEETEYNLKVGDKIKLNGKIFSISEISVPPEEFLGKKEEEYISGDNLSENFIVRPWQKGDKFYPIGFKGSKKISDFLTDIKISSEKKKERLVLVNQNKIVWVLGLRLDERFKITNHTKRILKIWLK